MLVARLKMAFAGSSFEYKNRTMFMLLGVVFIYLVVCAVGLFIWVETERDTEGYII